MSFSQWLQQLDFNWVIQTLITVPAALLCITFHETCHGLVAYWLGDQTAKRAGRLSLNPLRHIDWMGLAVMALCKFGWAKPVPVDARYFRSPKAGMAITALAGPISNVLLAAAAALFYGAVSVLEYKSGGVWQYISMFFQYIVLLSAGLAVFNIFPIPPLDGSKVLFAVLPNRAWLWLMKWEKFGMILLMVLLLTGVLDTPLSFLRDGLLTVFNPLARLSFDTLAKIIL